MAMSEADARIFFQAYDRDFAGLCQATMFQICDRFGTPTNPQPYPSAISAARASNIYTKDPAQAKNGDFAYWDESLTRYGHVALWVNGKFLMGSTRVTDRIGGKSRNVGFISFDDYSKTGFLGFASSNGVNDVEVLGKTPTPAGQVVDWVYWEPGGELAKRVQRALKAKGRYSGVVDGVFGPATRKGVQTTLSVSGIFKGVIDGNISRGGCYGIQQYAAKYGSYTGKIDGAPREGSWTGFALGLERP